MKTLAIKQLTQDSVRQKQLKVREDLSLSVPGRESGKISTQPATTLLLQGQCACGGGCPRCQEELGLQTKLKISEPGDQYAPKSSHGKHLVTERFVPTVQRASDRLFRKKNETVLEREGITDARIVDDAADIQKIIQDTLSDPNSKLFPYIKEKLKDLKSGKTKYSILDTSEFAYDYRKYAKKRGVSIDPSIKDEKLVEKIGGFYDPAKKSVYLKTRSNYCHAFHETIHSFSSPDVLSTWLGGDLMEGLTQFFTDVVFQEQLGKVCHTHDYGNQLKCATKLVDTVGFAPLASLFFNNEVSKLNTIVNKLGLSGTEDLQKLKSDGICKKLA